MKKTTVFFAALFIFLLINGNTYGKDKVIFGTFFIPYRVINETTGNFIDLTKIVAEKSGIDIQIVMQPTKRTLSDFKDQKFDGIFPGLDVFFPPGDEPVKSIVFDTKNDYIFTRKGSPLLRTAKDLEGKTVGLTSGYPYQAEFTGNPLIKFDEAQTDILNVRKLFKKRIEAFVCEENSGLTAFQEEGMINEVQYDPDTPLSKLEVFYAFQNNEKGKRLSEIVSKALQEMKNEGTLQKLVYPKVRADYKSLNKND